jgi:glycosyltransferase involved in cell wall biosynthesis
MGNLRILWFNWRCWLNPAMGGAEIFTLEVAKRWAKAGNDVTLFTSKFPACRTEEFLDGVHVIRSGGKYSVYNQAKKYYQRYFSKENFDVIIDEVNTRPFLTPKFAKKGEKVVSLIHQLAKEYWFYEMPFPISYIGHNFLEERWLRNYISIPSFTVSESTRKDLLNLGFNQVYVVPEGLNFEPLPNVPEKASFPVIIYVGRLRRAKRPDHVIKAFRIVRSRFPEAELWVIGDGSFKTKLLGMAEIGVRFFSGLSNEVRRNLIKQAWVLVNPSVREGFGLNVVEANALGVPCIAYDVGGLRDSIINGETGLLIKSGDIPALAEEICHVIADAALRVRLSENALVYSRSFSWDKAAEVFLSFIKTI